MRSILEYVSPIWSHNLVKDIKEMEVIQSKASKIALKEKKGEMPYEQHCKLLKWDFFGKRIVYSIHLSSRVSFFVRIIDQWNGLPHNLVEEGNFISYIWTNITQRFSYERDFSLGF